VKAVTNAQLLAYKGFCSMNLTIMFPEMECYVIRVQRVTPKGETDTCLEKNQNLSIVSTIKPYTNSWLALSVLFSSQR
jgi:hypothetical protein